MSEYKKRVLALVLRTESTSAPINLGDITRPAGEVLQAAALNETIAFELDVAATHFEGTGELTVAQSLRDQASELRTTAAQLRAAAEPSEPQTAETGPLAGPSGQEPSSR